MTRHTTTAPMRRTAASLVAALSLVAFACGVAYASLPKPAPGSPKQVLALVKASDLIHKLPQPLDPGLVALGGDDPPSYYPQTMNGCTGTSQCVFGDVDSSTVVVLFGDSHALMWLPALAPVASRDGFRLVVEWMPGCPAASVSVWDSATNSTNTACNSFRRDAIASIRKLDPTLVLLADRTSYVRATRTMLIPDDVWQKGEEATISALLTKTTGVAVVGDITIFNFNVVQCMAGNTKNVQSCSVRNPNPKFNDHFAQEKAAAKAESVPYLNPQPWLCTNVCSPVIGNMGVYFDSAHVSSTYAEYLARLWSAAIKPLLTRHPASATATTR
jgi:SGNH domain (fused to AT3 domains)